MNDTDALKKQIADLTVKLDKLTANYGHHQHSGFDTSLKLTGELDLSGVTHLRLADNIDVSQSRTLAELNTGQTSASRTPAYLAIAAGMPVSIGNQVGNASFASIALPDLYESSNPVKLVHTIYNAKEWGLISFASALLGINGEQRQIALGCDEFDLSKGIRNSTDYSKGATFGLIDRDYSLGSYITGQQGPLTSGTVSVTIATNTLTDTGKNWTVNEFAGAHISVVDSLGNLDVHLVVSNTATVMTIQGVWAFSDVGASYAVFFPIVNGARFYPWRGLRMGINQESGKAYQGSIGIDDMTFGGSYTGDGSQKYIVKIAALNAPDTFQWSEDGGNTWNGPINVTTGGPISLNHGVTITFLVATGHAIDDSWAMGATNTIMAQGMGFGSRGFVITNPKFNFSPTVSGTPLTIEISLAGTPYYFLAYPKIP